MSLRSTSQVRNNYVSLKTHVPLFGLKLQTFRAHRDIHWNRGSLVGVYLQNMHSDCHGSFSQGKGMTDL